MIARSLAVLFAVVPFGALSAYAGADFVLHPELKELRMQAHFIYYGSGFAADSARIATEEIGRMWSESPDGKPFVVRVGSEDYDLRMEASYEIVAEADVRAIAKANVDPGVQFIRLEKGGNPGDRSFYYLSGNCGVFYESDELGISTTAAHEFGHGLGLPHPRVVDWRGKGRPPVMLPRGCLVDAQYQWDPSVPAGKPGGTVKPHTRKVLQFDIDNLDLGHKLQFDVEGRASLGRAQNTILGVSPQRSIDLDDPNSPWIE
ncbi:MAG: hypothetical protein JST04_17230 [Bdellovibrionales bacterium]|nr:hypothetical protein [Bdellovibrionales bacterium]